MRKLIECIDQNSKNYKNHPFMRRLRASEDRLNRFAPLLSFWVGCFQDLLRINETLTKNTEIKKHISKHRAEDMGHEKWFFSDLEILGAGTVTLRDLFGHKHEKVRDISYKLISEAINIKAEPLRLVLLHAVEAAGHPFFYATAAYCKRHFENRGLKYLSSFHIDVERAHEMFHLEKEEQFKISLSDAAHKEGTDMILRVQSYFQDLFDYLEACEAGIQSQIKFFSIKEEINEGSNTTYLDVVNWINSYLNKPNPDLGRSGNVCPYVQKSLDNDSIWIGIVEDENIELGKLETMLEGCLEFFLKKEPLEGEGRLQKALIVAFPNMEIDTAERLIEEVHKSLKPIFIKSGAMIGKFHQRSKAPGLHNPSFRPLSSPIPMIAIRYLVANDLVFMTKPDEPESLHKEFLSSYLHQLGSELGVAQKQKALKKLEQLHSANTPPSDG